MSTPIADVRQSLAERIVQRISDLVLTAERETKPLELDPYRSQLFELFVTAEGAGYLAEDADHDLTAEALCRELGDRWGLGQAAKDSAGRQAKMANEDVAKMRALWALLRMWMEWTYAWSRWAEFHAAESSTATPRQD